MQYVESKSDLLQIRDHVNERLAELEWDLYERHAEHNKQGSKLASYFCYKKLLPQVKAVV